MSLDLSKQEFDALVEVERQRYVGIFRARAQMKRALDAAQSSGAIPDAGGSALWLRNVRLDLVSRLREAEQRMLDTCEIMYEGPLKLLVFIPAARRRVQDQAQVVADLGREIGAVFAYALAWADLAVYDETLSRAATLGADPIKTCTAVLENAHDVIEYWPLISYDIKVFYGLRHNAQAEVAGALSARFRQFGSFADAMEHQRAIFGSTSRSEELARIGIAAVADLGAATADPRLRPEDIRIGDYTVLSMGAAFHAGFIPTGFVALTDEVCGRWKGTVDGKGKRKGGLVSAIAADARVRHRRDSALVGLSLLSGDAEPQAEGALFGEMPGGADPAQELLASAEAAEYKARYQRFWSSLAPQEMHMVDAIKALSSEGARPSDSDIAQRLNVRVSNIPNLRQRMLDKWRKSA